MWSDKIGDGRDLLAARLTHAARSTHAAAPHAVPVDPAMNAADRDLLAAAGATFPKSQPLARRLQLRELPGASQLVDLVAHSLEQPFHAQPQDPRRSHQQAHRALHLIPQGSRWRQLHLRIEGVVPVLQLMFSVVLLISSCLFLSWGAFFGAIFRAGARLIRRALTDRLSHAPRER